MQETSTRITIRPHDLAVAVAPLVGALLGLYLGLNLLWATADFIVLTMAAALAAVALNHLAAAAQRRVGLPRKAGVLLLVVLAIGGGLALAAFAGGQIASEFANLAKEVPRSLSGLRETVLSNPLGEHLRPLFSEGGNSLQPARIFGSLGGWVSSFAGAVSGLFFFLAVSFYLAIQPDVYVGGLLRLLKTPSRQRKARQVLDELYDRLWNFLLGQFSAMALIGVLTALGLSVLGIPYALALGLTAGALCFIPVLGPALSFVPAVLVGLSEGTDEALKVALLYAGIQAVESNLITPLIQKRMADVPPALLLLSQAVAGALFGFVGVALAAPIVVVAMVLVEQLHLQPERDPAEISVGSLEESQPEIPARRFQIGNQQVSSA